PFSSTSWLPCPPSWGCCGCSASFHAAVLLRRALGGAPSGRGGLLRAVCHPRGAARIRRRTAPVRRRQFGLQTGRRDGAARPGRARMKERSSDALIEAYRFARSVTAEEAAPSLAAGVRLAERVCLLALVGLGVGCRTSGAPRVDKFHVPLQAVATPGDPVV